MKNYYLYIMVAFMLLTACASEDVIDLSSTCERGDMYMVDQKDTFPAQHSRDSFFFIQGAGVHRFIWTYSFANRLSVDVAATPDPGETIKYPKSFIRDLRMTYRGQEYVLDLKTIKDSSYSMTNTGSEFVFKFQEAKFTPATNQTIKLRACDLRMTDFTP